MCNMECPNDRELMDYALGKTSDERSEQIDVHLEGCQTCTNALVATHEPSDTLVSNLRQPRAPDPYTQDPKLREVLAVVQAIGREPSFVSSEKQGTEMFAVADHADRSQPASAEDLGTIRDYQLLARLGQGGMGTVYKALHRKLEKVVALKVLPADRMKDAHAVARFEQEMRAVGRLQHPNIVGAHDAGEHEGTHFLVMEYVDGVDLSELVHQLGPLPVADACELIRQAAIGLQHAHEHSLVHRDIKPSNLMLSQCSPVSPSPDMAGLGDPRLHSVLKILDLGLARLHNGDRAELTSTGQMMGTVDYMAPEQTGDSKDVDIRADVYSLGATLFKLLTNQAPYADAQYNTVIKKLKAMATEPIPAIRALRADVPEELAAILGKMLAKDADDRFATPQEVAEALAAFADDADLAALSVRYHETYRSDRDTTPDVEASRRGTEEHLSSSMTETRTEKSECGFEADLSRNMAGVECSEPPEKSDLGAHSVRRQPPDGFREGEAPAEPRSSAVSARREPRPPGIETTAGEPARWNRNTKIAAVVLGLAGLFAAAMVIRVATNKGEIKITAYDPEIEVTVKRNGEPVDGFQVKQRPDGTSFYSGDYEIEIAGGTPDGVKIENKTFQLTRGKDVLVEIVRVEQVGQAVPDESLAGSRQAEPDLQPAAPQPAWQLGSAEDVLPGLVPRPAKLPGVKRWQVDKNAARTRLFCVAWSPDGSRIACGTDEGLIRIYDAKSLALVDLLIGHTAHVKAVAWSPDGTLFASSADDGTARIWDSQGACITVFKENVHPDVNCLSWHPDGQRLASGGYEGKVRIWGLDGKQQRVIDMPGGDKPLGVASVAWSPDGKELAVGGGFPWNDTNVLQIWDSNGTECRTLAGHKSVVRAVAWAPDGERLASGSRDGTVRVWNADGTESAVLEYGTIVHDVAWNSNGKRLVSCGYDDKVRIWSAEGTPGPVLEGHMAEPLAVAWSPDGKQIVSADERGVLRLCNEDGGLVKALGRINDVFSVDWNRADDGVAAAASDQSVRIWTSTGDPRRTLGIVGTQVLDHGCRWSPDGKRLASCPWNSTRIWESDGSERPMPPHRWLLGWSPDGSMLATRYGTWTLEVWNREDNSIRAEFPSEIEILAMDWSPDDKQLLVGKKSSVEIWDLKTQEKRIVTEGSAESVAWSPDGKWLATSYGGYLNLWLAKDGELPVFRRGQESEITSIAWRADGRELITGGYRGVYLWDVSDDPGERLDGQLVGVTSVAWSADGRLIAAGSYNDLVQVWDAASGDPQWVSLVLADDQNITFNAAGQILHGDPDVIEHELVYIIETDAGRLEVLKPSEFQERIGESIRHQLAGQAVPDEDMAGDSGVDAGSRQAKPDLQEADRRAAEWVLAVGGRLGVEVEGKRVGVETVDELPNDSFRVVDIYLIGCTKVDDASLALLSPLTDLQGINLCGASNVGDAGVQRLAKLPSLLGLNLQATKVTDDGLKQIAQITALEGLHLGGTSVTTAGLTSLLPLKNLKELYLGDTKTNDTTLACLARFEGLQKLELRSTAISDAGLDRLQRFRQLESLDLVNTAVTANAVAALHDALPNCRIDWDGGTIEPRWVVNRRVAEWVLSKGGSVSYSDEKGGSGRAVSLTDLPQRPSKIRSIALTEDTVVLEDDDLAQITLVDGPDGLWIGGAQLTDRAMQHVAKLRALTNLKLYQTSVTDAGVGELVTLTNLQTLTLDNALISDAALESISKLDNLESLSLLGTDITDAGLVHLAKLGNLCSLGLEGTRITDKGIQHLVKLPLTRIAVPGTGVGNGGVEMLAKLPKVGVLGIGGPNLTNDGLAHLVGLPELESLSVKGAPRVTDDGLEHIGRLEQLKSLQLCHLGITDAGLAHLPGLVRLSYLDLYSDKVTDDGLQQLASLKSLKHLSVLHCTQITTEGMAKLHEALPQCRIRKLDLSFGPTDDSDARVND